MANEVQKRKAGLTSMMAARFEMDPTMFLATIKDTVMPSSATQEEVAAFLMVAKEYDMNPLLREIHAFPKKGGGIQTVVGVDGWAKIITRHKHFDGADFAYEDKDGKPYSCTCTLFRKDTAHPVTVTEFYEECFRATEPWKQMPRRMLRHKALMQCGRIAFGLSGIVDEDEARDFCEVDAVVVEDDPLSPGRHTKRKQSKQSDALPEPTPEEQAKAAQRRKKMKAQLENPKTQEPESPEAYQILYASHANRPGDVDKCLAGAGLPPLPKIVWQDLSQKDIKKLGLAVDTLDNMEAGGG